MGEFARVRNFDGSLVFRAFVNDGRTDVGAKQGILRVDQPLGVGKGRIIEMVITGHPELLDTAPRRARAQTNAWAYLTMTVGGCYFAVVAVVEMPREKKLSLIVDTTNKSGLPPGLGKNG